MTQTLRFSSIHLENWRNFVRTQTELQRRIFLVGPNASGKSNFLDVSRFLRDIVSVGGGLEEAVRKRGGLSRLRCLAARNPSDVVVAVSLGNDDQSRVWEYELRLTQDKKERPVIKRERVALNGSSLLTRPNADDKVDTERLTQTYLQQVNVNREFRAVADFFGSVRYLHIVPQLVREPDRSAGRSNDPYGGDFLEQVAREHGPEKAEQPERAVRKLLLRLPRSLWPPVFVLAAQVRGATGITPQLQFLELGHRHLQGVLDAPESGPSRSRKRARGSTVCGPCKSSTGRPAPRRTSSSSIPPTDSRSATTGPVALMAPSRPPPRGVPHD